MQQNHDKMVEHNTRQGGPKEREGRHALSESTATDGPAPPSLRLLQAVAPLDTSLLPRATRSSLLPQLAMMVG